MILGILVFWIIALCFIEGHFFRNILFLLLIIFGVLFAKRVFASDWSSCGIKPPPPVECIHCAPICVCTGKSCQWAWVAQ